MISSFKNLNNPSQKAVSVTPSDSDDLDEGNCVALYIGGAGDVNATLINGTTAVFVGLAAGSILPVQCSRVLSTSTTATNILALY